MKMMNVNIHVKQKIQLEKKLVQLIYILLKQQLVLNQQRMFIFEEIFSSLIFLFIENRTEDIAPSFIRKLRNCTVIEGQRAKFDCFITGQPNPTIRWLQNGLPLDVDSNLRKYSSQLQSNGKVILTIEDCLQEDAGEITIIVENRAGSTQCSAELTVERKGFFF